MTVILLGPQRFRPSVRNTVRSLEVDGPVATVTAGWREREPDDAELDEMLDGRSVNLRLYRRRQDVMQRDAEFAAAARERSDTLKELHTVYVLRLDHAIAAVSELVLRDIHAPVAASALDDAIDAVRTLDARHLELVGEVHAEFYDRTLPHERDAIVEHRTAVASALQRCAAVTIAGGHIGALLWCLNLFNVAPALTDKAVVAWSAGAMVLCDRIVLFNDHAPDGRSYAEVYDSGLGLCHGIVALPHARRRLRLEDPVNVLVFARRFTPAHCVVLDDGVRVDCPDRHCCAPGTRVLTRDGRVEELERVV
ncbi:MAG: hypothetical protein GEU74_03340 [Nitriliruptorales bacterium]|nr:hypothetical protein [Nitriliruptorales bacterium]